MWEDLVLGRSCKEAICRWKPAQKTSHSSLNRNLKGMYRLPATPVLGSDRWTDRWTAYLWGGCFLPDHEKKYPRWGNRGA